MIARFVFEIRPRPNSTRLKHQSNGSNFFQPRPPFFKDLRLVLRRFSPDIEARCRLCQADAKQSWNFHSIVITVRRITSAELVKYL